MGLFDNADVQAIQWQLTRMERKLDLIMARLEIRDEAPPDPPEIVELIRQNKKIQAIKVFREQTGAGLRVAKDAVDEIERRQFGR